MSTKVDKSEMFSGKTDGITFEKLDEKVLSWVAKKSETSTLRYYGKTNLRI